MKRFCEITLIGLFFFLFSCSENRFEVDISSVDYDERFLRLDRDIFDPEEAFFQEGIAVLGKKYGSFLEAYTGAIMQMPPPDNPMLPEFLNRFAGDITWRKLQGQIDEVYPDLTVQQNRLAEAVRVYSIHFEEEKLPRLVAYNSGFNVGIYPTDDWLGVGLEWYLGPDNETVKQLPPDVFPQYKRDKMKPDYLVPNAFKGWLFFKHQDLLGENMLSALVFNGKMLYVSKALTEESDANMLNYSREALEWCEDSEYMIWTFLLENDLVFSTDFRQINKMMNDGPFTPGMPPESPGGVGNWVGLQMVEAYMEDNKDVTLRQLLKVGERQILESYKPGR